MKVMLSMPDKAVEALDLLAKRQDKSRSQMVIDLAEAELKRDRTARRNSLRELLEAAEEHDGRGTEHVAADRRR